MISFASDSKKALEKELRGNSKEVELPKPPKRPLEESTSGTSLAKKRKEQKDTEKAQKAAAVVTANKMAQQIFQERNTNVNKHLQDIQKLTDKVDELSEKLEDKQSSIEAKRVVISNLEDKVKELEDENMMLRCELDDTSKYNPQNTTGKCIDTN